MRYSISRLQKQEELWEYKHEFDMSLNEKENDTKQLDEIESSVRATIKENWYCTEIFWDEFTTNIKLSEAADKFENINREQYYEDVRRCKRRDARGKCQAELNVIFVYCAGENCDGRCE